ncbi:hypothetical protein EV286_107328 [Rhizobium sp. BK251]|nr:hypothetical protein EV286_107328 [Rhizobium sp. BK251]
MVFASHTGGNSRSGLCWIDIVFFELLSVVGQQVATLNKGLAMSSISFHKLQSKKFKKLCSADTQNICGFFNSVKLVLFYIFDLHWFNPVY